MVLALLCRLSLRVHLINEKNVSKVLPLVKHKLIELCSFKDCFVQT